MPISLLSAQTVAALLKILALLAALFLLLPRYFFSPIGSGLDISWAMSLHYAFRDRLVFGEDLVFTFGPLGVLATRLPIGEGITLLLCAWDLFFYLSLLNVLWFAVSASARLAPVAVIALALFHSFALYLLDPPFFLLLFSVFWLFRFQDTHQRLSLIHI